MRRRNGVFVLNAEGGGPEAVDDLMQDECRDQYVASLISPAAFYFSLPTFISSVGNGVVDNVFSSLR